MVLKDVECCSCGHVAEAMLEGDETQTRMLCTACGVTIKHTTICNGGCGKRYRYHDWDGVDFAGQVRLGEISAETQLPESQGGGIVTDKHKSGAACHDLPRFSSESRADRLERMKHRRKCDRGRATLYFDGARRA